MLQSDEAIDLASLRPGEFLTAVQRKKRSAPTIPPPPPALAAATAATAAGAPMAAAGEPGSPAYARQQRPGPASPGAMDTLLPGYALRPNRSPLKPARLLPPPPAVQPLDAAGSAPAPAAPDGASEERPAKRTRATLLDLARGRLGVPDPHKQRGEPGVAGSSAQAGSGGLGAGARELFAELQAELRHAQAAGAAADEAEQQRKQQQQLLLEQDAQKQASKGGKSSGASAAPRAGGRVPRRKQTIDAGASSSAEAAEAQLHAAALALPLPPALERLEWAFGVVGAVLGFLQNMHIQVGTRAAGRRREQ